MRAYGAALCVIAAAVAGCSREAPRSSSVTASGTTTTSAPQPPGRSPSPGSTPQAGVRVIDAMTASVKIPVVRIDTDPQTRGDALGPLTIRIERQDREPEGPQSFDVLPDGRFVIADPLRDRLVVYEPGGKAQREIPIGGAARVVAAVGSEAVRIVSAVDGTAHTFDFKGREQPATRGAESQTPRAAVKLDDDRSGSVQWTSTRSDGRRPADLRVLIDEAKNRLASLQIIAVDEEQRPYIAVEAADRSGRSLESLSKTVRRYSPGGALEAEVRKIPIDYYIVPVTEFRVVGGVLYQLMPRQDAVFINVWTIK